MALLPPEFMPAVVALGDHVGPKAKDFSWNASGFLYGHHILHWTKTGDEQKYLFALVTNKHVLKDKDKKNKKEIYARFNPVGTDPPKVFRLPLVDGRYRPIWKGHPNPDIDVAVAQIDLNVLRREKINFGYFLSNTTSANTKKLKTRGINEGDSAYVLGFPMGLVGEKRQTVLVRGGVIARIRDVLDGHNTEFLVDAQIFPGNSGGPVVLKPEASAVIGTKPQMQAFLIGVVKGYVTYRDFAVSRQTGRPRVIFEENSGLVQVHPIDYVQDLMRQLIHELNLRRQ